MSKEKRFDSLVRSLAGVVGNPVRITLYTGTETIAATATVTDTDDVDWEDDDV